MKLRTLTALQVLLFVLAACMGSARCSATAAATPALLSYVQAPDASYSWKKIGETKLETGGTVTKITMTSQTWQKIPWTHAIDIVRPKKVRDGSTVLLLVNGGDPNGWVTEVTSLAAEMMGMPVATLYNIPNQPLFDGLYEDALIAHTLVQYLQTGDKTWPLLFPMTKSAVRAMDTIQKVSASEWKTPVKGFVVTGASKRGWTTWLTGAVDKRVVGIAPMVFDNLNIPAQMERQLTDYGGYSKMISDYTEKGLPQLLKTEKGREIVREVDPYSFVSGLTMPKLILISSNDPYWTLESSSLYYGDLPGDKHIYLAPNIGHDIQDRPEMLPTLAAFAVDCSRKRTLPKVTWDYQETPDGLRLTVHISKGTPWNVRVWTAVSESRDFRAAKWAEQKLTSDTYAWTFTLPRPKTGYAAVFGEAGFQEGEIPVFLSTTPKIIGAK